MRQKIKLTYAAKNNNELHLTTDIEIAFEKLEATGQMLVDSDHFSFIYIGLLDSEYTYLVLEEEVWPMLKEALTLHLDVYLVSGESKLKLSGFHEEMTYLIENIKGNSNYGKEMVEKVESNF